MENLSKQHGGVYEILYYQKNGQGIWLQEEIVSIRNEQNIIVLFLVTFRDITPFKEPLEGQSVMSNLSKFARLAWTITRARPNNNLAPSRYVLVTVWTVVYYRNPNLAVLSADTVSDTVTEEWSGKTWERKLKDFWKFCWKRNFGFWKKQYYSDTKIGPWFRLPIP